MDDPKLKSKPASPSHSSDRALSSLLQSSHSPMSPSITAFDFTQTMAQGPHCPGLRTPMQTIEQKPAGPLIRLPYVSASCLAQNLRLSPHHPCPASLSCLGKYDFRPSLRGRPAILLLMCVCLSASRGGRVQAREEMLIHTAHESILWSGGASKGIYRTRADGVVSGCGRPGGQESWQAAREELTQSHQD